MRTIDSPYVGKALRLAVIMTMLAALVATASPLANAADPPTEWEVVTTIPNANDGFWPRGIWTGEEGVVYVATARSTPGYDYALLRWDGEWSVEIDLPGYYFGPLFGTAPSDIYAAAYTCEQPDGSWSCPSGGSIDSKLFRFDGLSWTEQTLPASVAGKQLTSISGVPGEVQVGIGPSILRNTVAGWTEVYNAGVGYTVWPRQMTFLGADEAYIASCWGHGWWDGVSWTTKIEFDFCDDNDMWGIRDDAGDLHLWVVGNNNFSNGIRIWKYDEASQSFGSKYGYEFGDPCCGFGSTLQGNASGIWGAAWDDVYVTGGRWTTTHPYPGTPEGRIYHNDGTGWSPLTLPGDALPTDVWGTGHDDVWFSLHNGELLHLGVLNHPPVADDQGVTTPEDEPIDIQLTGSDPDGPITEMTVVTEPEHGTLGGEGLPLPVVYTPDPDWYGTDSFTFTVGDGELTSDPATVTITVTPVNDPPVVGALADQTVQYSDGIVPIAMGATDIDSASLSFSATGLPTGLSFGATTCVPDGDGSVCTTAIEGAAAAPAGTYPATITVTDDGGLTDSESVTITIFAEDATVSFPAPPDQNSVAWQVDGDDDDIDLVSLTVLVEETFPDAVFGAQTPHPGDLNDVALDIELVPVGPGGSVSGSCVYGVGPGGYAGLLTASCTFADVPVNTYTVAVEAVGGYYTGSNEDVLVVYDPSLGFTTGGGWFYWPGTDDKTNFGYTMKYNKKGNNVKGSLLLIRHLDDGTKYRVKSNALGGLAIGSTSDMGWASFTGKATYLEPGWDEPIGNHGFIVYVEDYGEPGADSDRFWLETHDKDGNVISDLSMERNATDHTTTISGGNIVAPH